jgi:membrane associated rhomboid family serine protease
VILPLGDAPNPRGIPFVTYALIAANVAVYVLITVPLSVTAPDPRDPLLREYADTIVRVLPREAPVQQLLRDMSAYDLFVFRYGFRPVDPSLPTLFYSLFLHAGFLHLFGNMLFLWIYGDNVEHRLRAPRYLLAYLGTGVSATLFHMLFASDSPLPLVGASGAISGVLGFYFLWFPRNSVRLLVFFFPFLMQVVTVPARLLLGLYLIADNLLPFILTRGGGGGGVAHGAHIGGFLAGLASAWVTDRRVLRQRPREYVNKTAQPTGGLNLEAALEGGRFAEAAQLYFSLPPDATRRLLSPAASLALAEWLAEHGHPRAALVVYRRHLRDYPDDETAAEAHLGAGLLQLQAFGQPTAAYQHFLDAIELAPSAETAARARAAIESITAMQKFPLRRVRGRS